MYRTPLCVLLILVASRTLVAEDEVQLPQGPPPRFVTFAKLDDDHAVFAYKVLHTINGPYQVLEYSDGTRRATYGSNVQHYIQPTVGFTVPLAKAQWYSADGKELDRDATWKSLKPSTIILLSADGNKVDAQWLQLFNNDARVLVIPARNLPLPYEELRGSGTPITKVEGKNPTLNP
jgi:hypothetical protein